MKTTNLYEIRDKAISSGRAVFSARALAHLIGKPLPTARTYLDRLVKKGLAKRLMKGKISFSDDDFVIATQLVEPSYISLHSALRLHGLMQQMPSSVQCVTPKNSLSIKALGLRYHKIPPSLFFGYERVSRGGSYALVACAEKAVLDGWYLGVFDKKILDDMSGKLVSEKLKELATRYKGYGSRKIARMMR